MNVEFFCNLFDVFVETFVSNDKIVLLFLRILLLFYEKQKRTSQQWVSLLLFVFNVNTNLFWEVFCILYATNKHF